MKGAELTIFENLLSSICEQMGITLSRGAFSPNIRDRKDFSCAIFDNKGNLTAQACHIPVHLGSMAYALSSIVSSFELKEGDVLIVNDPYSGGTHLPDITLIAPFFCNGTIEAYVASRAHHADVGGKNPGSMAPSLSIHEEGVLIRPLLLWEKGILNEKRFGKLLTTMRNPYERSGDLMAQYGAINTGLTHLGSMEKRYGIAKIKESFSSLIEASSRYLKTKLASLPNGRARYTDYLDDDGITNEKVKIQAEIEINNDVAIIDFSGTAQACRGNLNCPFSVTASAVLYAFRCLLPKDCPASQGLLSPLTITAPEGCLVNARFPSAVSAGNVETSQRIVDVVLGALSKLCPDEIPAASAGTMNNLSIGRGQQKKSQGFAYYETIGGGAGATAYSDGASGIQTHMTNTLNTPIEVIEMYYPLQVTRYSIRKDSGGKGTFNGGNGVIREFEALEDVEVSLLTDRRVTSPYGLCGGNNGKPGANELIFPDGSSKTLPGKTHFTMKKHDRLNIQTPGGGGYGNGKEEKEKN